MSKNTNIWADVLLEQDLSACIGELTTGFSDSAPSSSGGGKTKKHRSLNNSRLRPYQIRDNEKRKRANSTNNDINSNHTFPKRGKKPVLNCPVLKVGVPRTLRSKLELEEGLSAEVVAEEIRYRIWEQKRWMLLALVKAVGNTIAIELTTKVTDIERNGGIALDNGRRRQPGGVFIHLLRQRDDVDLPAINKILSEHNQMEKKKHKKKSH